LDHGHGTTYGARRFGGFPVPRDWGVRAVGALVTGFSPNVPTFLVGLFAIGLGSGAYFRPNTLR
jgi:hypothetical protein